MTVREMSGVLLVVSAVAAPGCATVQPVPPDVVAPIERRLPSLPSTPAPASDGKGLLVLDSVSGTARAERVAGRVSVRGGSFWSRTGTWGAEGVVWEPLCTTTPCAAYVPYGPQRVALESNDHPARRAVFDVQVTDKPQALRASLPATIPESSKHLTGSLLLGGGFAGFSAGLVLATIPVNVSSDTPLSQQSVSPTALGAGIALLGLSTISGIVGAILMSKGGSSMHYDERVVQWELEPGELTTTPRTDGQSVGEPVAPGPASAPRPGSGAASARGAASAPAAKSSPR
jgi:hypothetical protein